MKQSVFTVASNRAIAANIHELRLFGDTSAITAPGQFVNIRLEGFFLRRPISVCDWDGEGLTLVYKLQGRGTAALAEYRPGKELDILTGLGNGYDLSPSGPRPLLVGGGVGTPPLYGLAKRLKAEGKQPVAVLGFNTADEVILLRSMEDLGVPVTLCTADGSAGILGFVTEGMKRAGDYSHLYACGPEPMLKAVWEACRSGGQFSFEERMGCGFGACMGCSCRTKYGNKRICKDGPVLAKEEILWRTPV
ncbi:MAG: dihydroorotate dehydrogenase electron transfer subunit [Oscillospiraceae bacterium]|nr:dihydroorotate dehydrogenase electron transfer subunit [Oscillospiraceae bacterium]